MPRNDKASALDREHAEYKKAISSWVSQLRKAKFPESMSGTIERFKRDCDLLVSDINANHVFSVNDLVDFTNRHDSLEVQFHQLKSHLS